MSYENFGKLIKYFRKYQEADLFPIVAVTGPLGSGKSSFSMQCSIKYSKNYFNEKHYFSCKKYIAYDNPEVLSKYYNLPEFSPLIADEAARFAMGEDWNKAINKELKKVTAQIRPRHLLFLMNIPNFLWLDRKYRDELVCMWVWVPIRGYAIIFQPDDNPGESDRWHLADFRKYKYRISLFSDIQRIYNLVSKHKCFFDLVQFPKVPEDIYQEYLKLREQKTYTENKENFVDQKELAKIMVYNIKNNWEPFLNAIKEGRFEKPSYKMISDNLLVDPISKEKILQFTTIRNWEQEIMSKLTQQEA